MNNFSPAKTSSDGLSIPLKIAAIYALVGGLWILFSDRFLVLLVNDPETLTRLQTLKGWFYIIVTAWLLYVLVQRSIANLQQSEQTLRESEEKFRHLSEEISEGIAITINGRNYWVNNAFSDIFGYTQEELIGKGVEFLIVPEEVPLLTERMKDRLAGKDVPPHYETIAQRRDGKRINIDVSAKLITFEGKQAIQIVVRDITERLRAEEALQKYTERLQILREIDQAILEAQSPEAIAQAALQRIRQLVPCQHIGLMVFDFDIQEVTVLAAHPKGEAQVDTGARLPLEVFGLTEEFQQGQVIVVEDILSFSQLTPMQQAMYADGVRAYIRIPLITQGELIGSLNLARESPGAFAFEHVEIAREVADQLAVAIQQAHLYEQVQRHTAKLEQRVAERTAELEHQYRRQAALAEIELAINEPHELQAVLDRIAEVATEFLPASGGASVILWDGQAETFTTSSTTVPGQDPKTASRQVRRRGGASRWIVDHRQPLVVPDVRDDPFGANRMLPDFGNQAYAGVPLLAEGEAIGVLYALDRQPKKHTQEDLNFMLALANRAAATIIKVRLSEHAQDLAALNERQRLARDLHDAVSQTLFSASVIAETLPRLWERNPEGVRQGLEDLQRLTRGALAEMRTLLLELRPTAFEESVLDDLLGQLIEGFAGRTKTAVTLQIEGQRSLTPEVRKALFRIAQEALNNVAKHARASQVQVNLRSQPEQVELIIRDDGHGFDPKRIPAGCLGLGIMHERAEAIGATLTVSSQTGEGTEVVVTWAGAQ